MFSFEMSNGKACQMGINRTIGLIITSAYRTAYLDKSTTLSVQND